MATPRRVFWLSDCSEFYCPIVVLLSSRFHVFAIGHLSVNLFYFLTWHLMKTLHIVKGRRLSKSMHLQGRNHTLRFFFVTAFYTLTSSLLRTNQTFNLTISNSCMVDYTVDFGDSTPVKSLTNPQKIVSHIYTSAGKYNIVIRSSNAPSGCIKATSQSVEVRDPIQNMVRNFALNPGSF